MKLMAKLTQGPFSLSFLVAVVSHDQVASTLEWLNVIKPCKIRSAQPSEPRVAVAVAITDGCRFSVRRTEFLGTNLLNPNELLDCSRVDPAVRGMISQARVISSLCIKEITNTSWSERTQSGL